MAFAAYHLDRWFVVEDGKVPPDLFSLSSSKDDDSQFVVSGTGRLGAASEVVDLATNLPEEDEAISKLASRFRNNPIEMSASSLDEAELDGVSDQALQGFMLDAFDAPSEVEEVTQPPVEAKKPLEKLPVPSQTLPSGVGVAKAKTKSPAAQSKPTSGVLCPNCHGLNPPGMRYCVQCGGGLSILSKSGVIKAPKKIAPPASGRARETNPWSISLVSINEDGSDGVEVPLEFLETTLGREGDTRFPTDAFLSPKHARFHVEDGVLSIEDLYSLNGIFIKLKEEIKLSPGDTFLMGRQVLRFERFEQSIKAKTKSSDGTRYMGSPSPGGSFKILQIGIGGIVQNVYCFPDSGSVLGREKGDIIFPHDKFMSSRHAQIYTGDDGHCYLVDLTSSNGTWVKIWEKTKLANNDFIFMGQQLFRVNQKK